VNCANDGKFDFGFSRGFAWGWLETPTIITFAEPATIDTVELILSDLQGRKYNYRVSISRDGERWQTVANTSGRGVNGWQMHRFPAMETTGVRLDFAATRTSARSYHIVEVAAWHLGESTARPLAAQWSAQRERRSLEALRFLGVCPAQAVLSDVEIRERVRALGPAESFREELGDDRGAVFMRDGRHILVGIDDDGDMPVDATAADLDNDCVAVDMNADGIIDRTIDRDDTNGDGVADRMVQTYGDRNTWGNRPFMVLIRDLDRGERSLWALHDWGYSQEKCQWDCDFGGDGWFAMFRRAQSGDGWVATFEAPFCFYDSDGDGLAEETVRITAIDTKLTSARYGINVDSDVTEGQFYDYDMGLTCLGSVDLPPDASEVFEHRSGEKAGPFLAWDKARETVRGAAWERALLVWDENDHNVAELTRGPERWEGIINLEYEGFPQEGGPPTLRMNKRFELDSDFSGATQLYWWAADGRLHLFGAEIGSLKVDYDYDGAPELVVEYSDDDADGFFDMRTISYPGTDIPNRRVRGPSSYGPIGSDGSSEAMTYAYSYGAVSEPWRQALGTWTGDCAELLVALRAAVEEMGLPAHAGPMEFYRGATPADLAFIEKHRASAEARRYYQDIAIELCFARAISDARDAGAEPGEIGCLLSARAMSDAGDVGGAAERLRD